MTASRNREKFEDQAEGAIEEIKSRYQDYRHSLLTYTQKNPIQALAIAAGAGILAGIIWKTFRRGR